MAKHPTTAHTSDTVKAAADGDTETGAMSKASTTEQPGTNQPEQATQHGKRPSLEQRVAAIEAILRAQGHQLD